MKKILGYLRNPIVLRVLGGAILGALLVFSVYFIFKSQSRVPIENSLVSAPIISLSPLTPGKIIEIDVTDGQKVKKGDQLAVVGNEIMRTQTDGIIISTNNQIGTLASAQNPVIQMVDPNEMRIAATIDENKGLNQIKVGQVATFTIDALPGTKFWGYVDEIAPSAKQTQLAFSISSERPTQQFQVYIKFNTATYPQIKNGMSAKTTIFTRVP